MNQDIAALPWRLEHGDGEMDLRARFPSESRVLIMSDNDCEHHPIADCSCNFSCRAQYEQEANAAFIVKACNSHEQLVAALRFYANESDWDELQADAAASAFDRNTGSRLGSDCGEVARAALAAAEVSK